MPKFNAVEESILKKRKKSINFKEWKKAQTKKLLPIEPKNSQADNPVKLLPPYKKYQDKDLKARYKSILT